MDKKIIKILNKIINEDKIDLLAFLELGIFEEKILNPEEENDFKEEYEIFLALLLHLAQDALKEEKYELVELIQTAKKTQEIRYNNIITKEMDEYITNWFYYTNEYYQITFNKINIECS